MPTTSNFGWTTPADTDLVKNGALAIRTLGNGIDTTMAELKGGTTGQVLSKTSNTDMDFTWVTTDDANAIQNAIVDAKGDLIAATANDTPARLAVGNNGETLVADSSASTGLRWQGNYAAGKNAIINGDFRIWQRGTSYAVTNTGSYGAADRWMYWHNGSTAGTNTASQQSFTAGAAPVAGYEGQFFQRLTTTTLGTGQSIIDAWQRIEDVRTFAGQTVTVSFWVKTSGSTTIDSFLEQQFGSGGSTAVATTVISNRATTSSWQRVSGTITLPSISGKTIGTGNNLMFGVRFNGVANGATFDIWGVQVEAGSVATAFQTATGTLAGELAAAERYFQIVTGQMCSGSNTTTVYSGVNFRTQMRTAPTVALSAAMTITDAGADYTQSSANVSIVSSRANERGAQIQMGNFTGTTAHRPYSTTVTASQIQFSAEL